VSQLNVGPEALFQRLTEAEKAGCLGHGLILEHNQQRSPAFEKALAQFLAYLSCNDLAKRPCRVCESCVVFQDAGLLNLPHPDVQITAAENDNGDYTVDEVKEFRRFFGLTRAVSRNRVICILGAEGLAGQNSAPANALLKLLEEPRPNSYLLLCTRDANSLLPTIRSRCQSFKARDSRRAETVEVAMGWQSLQNWLEQADPTMSFPQDLPPFDDAFWKDREAAISELRQVYSGLWMALKGQWALKTLEDSRRCLGFFTGLEGLIDRLESHGNAGLQWLAFSRNAIIENSL